MHLACSALASNEAMSLNTHVSWGMVSIGCFQLGETPFSHRVSHQTTTKLRPKCRVIWVMRHKLMWQYLSTSHYYTRLIEHFCLVLLALTTTQQFWLFWFAERLSCHIERIESLSRTVEAVSSLYFFSRCSGAEVCFDETLSSRRLHEEIFLFPKIISGVYVLRLLRKEEEYEAFEEWFSVWLWRQIIAARVPIMNIFTAQSLFSTFCLS